MNLLDEGRFHMKSIVDAIEKKVRQFEVRKVQSSESPQEDEKLDEYECRDVHMTSEASFDLLSKVCSLRFHVHDVYLLLFSGYCIA